MVQVIHKSERMAEEAQALGWETEIKTVFPKVDENAIVDYYEIEWNLYCSRNKEKLHVTFLGTRQVGASYSYAGKTTHPAHRAAVMNVLRGIPRLPKKIDKPDQTLTKEEAVEEYWYVPFKIDSPAFDVMRAVLNKTITWVRTIDGYVMSGFVDKEINLGKKFFRVYTARSGRRILEWQDRDGFHAVALEQIVEVA